MIFNEWGVALWRRDVGEFDRLVVLLTERHGALPVRFGGVNRPAGKLKALSEPLVWGEYRLCLGPRSTTARVIGGRIESCFPGLRQDLSLTLQALGLCEMALRLVPESAASPEKYHLLCGALRALEAQPGPWVEIAFGLQLLEHSGWSLRELPVPPAERGLWRELHDTPIAEVFGLSGCESSARRFRQLVCDHIEARAERPLRCRDLASRWGQALPFVHNSVSADKENLPC
jgi:DNA repair protein RecO (recombination protein O)